jgi:hypothetical protein
MEAVVRVIGPERRSVETTNKIDVNASPQWGSRIDSNQQHPLFLGAAFQRDLEQVRTLPEFYGLEGRPGYERARNFIS